MNTIRKRYHKLGRFLIINFFFLFCWLESTICIISFNDMSAVLAAALQLHPDKNKHPKAEIAFKLVSEVRL